MDVILKKYDSFKIDECIRLLNEKRKVDDGLVENIIKENCVNVCLCLDAFTRSNINKINEVHTLLFRTYQNIVAVDLPGKLLPVQLELTTFFNFIWWNFYHTINENTEVYLPVIQKGLRRGISCKVNNYVNLTEDILCDIKGIGKKIQSIDYWTLSLLLEVIALTFLYILKIDKSKHTMEQCLLSVKSVIQDCNALVKGLAAVKDFKNPCFLYNKLFKFGVLKMNSKVSDSDTSPTDSLYVIKCVCLFYLKNYKLILLEMKENVKSLTTPLLCYLGGLTSLILGDFNQCLGFLIISDNMNSGNALKSRLNVLHGLLKSKRGEYRESLRFFGEAKKICPCNKAAHYYLGEEYGKIGLNEEMIQCFQTLVQIKEEEKLINNICPFESNFESVILDLLHPPDEISELEVVYAAAIALGIHERFEDAAKMFDKYFEIYPSGKREKSNDDRIIKTPDIVTVLHEAAAVNIQIGHLKRAQQLLEKSSDQYSVKERIEVIRTPGVHVSKDMSWIRNVLDRELGLGEKSTEKQSESVCLFAEEMVNFFEVDVIGLMLSAEIENRLKLDPCKGVLGKLISTFLKYISQLQKKEDVEEEDKNKIFLVKALSCKTCLSIAKHQMKGKVSIVETDRTFKRALTCNPGDKDVLYEYCKFLLAQGKTCDAQKLWKTFHSKESVANVDQCQSLALRFLLETRVSEKDLEKIGLDVEVSLVNSVDFDVIN